MHAYVRACGCMCAHADICEHICVSVFVFICVCVDLHKCSGIFYFFDFR